MKHFLTWLHTKLIINEIYYFEGSEEELKSRVDELKENKLSKDLFYSRVAGENYYEVIATVSLGVMQRESLLVDLRIKLHLKIKTIGQSQQQVTLFTRIRPENWFLAIIFIFCCIGLPVSGTTEFYLYPLVVVVFIISFLWFNLVYKMQEKDLRNKVTKKLGLKA